MTLPLDLPTPDAHARGASGVLPVAISLRDGQTAPAAQPNSAAAVGSHEHGDCGQHHSSAGAVLEVHVFGLPAPQGSKRAFRNPHSGRIQQVESSKKVKPWREAVKYAALDVIASRERTGDPYAIIGGPVYVETTFTLPRPKSHYRTGRNAHLLRDNAPTWPSGKPDIEKLVRSTRDALTDAGVWVDDAQVVDERNTKTFPAGHRDALPRPGAVIRIFTLSASPATHLTTGR